MTLADTPAAVRTVRLEPSGHTFTVAPGETLLEAAHYIETIERRQGLKIACPEEIAYRMQFISADDLRKLAEPLAKSGYGSYLLRVLEERLF